MFVKNLNIPQILKRIPRNLKSNKNFTIHLTKTTQKLKNLEQISKIQIKKQPFSLQYFSKFLQITINLFFFVKNMSTPYKLDNLKLTEYAAEVMVYFEKHKLIEIVTRLIADLVLERPEDVQRWIGENLIRIADEIYGYCRKNSYDGGCEAISFYQPPGKFLHRIIIFGRRGSGRKTQALALVKRFDLVYIDAEQLIYKSLNGTDELSLQLQKTFTCDAVCARSEILFKIIAKRLLQMDALCQGWVIVNYPNTLGEFKKFIEELKVPPNKIVYLKCPETMALRRLLEKPALGRPQDFCDYMKEEMRYFKENEEAINEYLEKRYETVVVDSTPNFETVKTAVWSHIDKTPYVMGEKN